MSSVIVIPDIHIPNEDKKTVAAIEHYMKWRNSRKSRCAPIERGVQLGDFQDFDCISSHNANKLRKVEGGRIRSDYDAGNAVLDRWQGIIPQWDIIEGNHDERVERYVDANPETEGMVEMEVGLNLRSRGVKFTRFWTKGEILRIGKARFIHGRYTNKYHAAKHVQTYGENIFFGHTHDVQEYSQEFLGDNKTMTGQSLGCVCRYDVDYMRGGPSKWQQAFAVFHFQPSGFFNHFVVRVFNHKFISPEGELFTPRGRAIAA